MEEYILYISFIALVISLVLQLIYHIHMFQQGGYVNKNQLKWLSEHKGLFILPVCYMIAGILGSLLGVNLNTVTPIAIFLVIILYTHLLKKPAKKKLVYTSRVKRLMATDIVILVAITAASFFIWGKNISSLFMAGLVLTFAPFVLMLSNICNAPIERTVKNHYINEAKAMLKNSNRLQVIGVTGSYGKTSVKYFLGSLLSAKYNVLITPESYNTPMGVVKTIRGLLKPSHDIFVCEMGARHVGDIKEICDIVNPTHGIITSIGPQHLETFSSMDNIIKTKFELADAVKGKGKLLLNGDNEYIKQNASNYEHIFYATDNSISGYKAEDIITDKDGTSFTVVAPNGERESYQTKLIGAHNVINIVGAIAMCVELGISLGELKLPVRRLKSVNHRLELIKKGSINIIDDAYNSNPSGARSALNTLSMFDGLKILVTPGMVELGEKEYEYNKEFGKQAAACCDYIVLVGKKRAVPLADGVREQGFDEEKLYIAESLNDAMSYVYAIRAEKEKYVLLENDLPDNIA